MRSLQRITRGIGRFLHPEKPGGIRGTTYAVACAVLLLAFGAQSLGLVRTEGVLQSQQQQATPTATAPPAADGGNDHLHAAPPVLRTAPRAVSGSWYVHGVTATTGQDLSPLLNHWGDIYHISPIGLAATVGVESGLNPYAERWAGGLDNSCGLAQQIITNVAFYTGILGAQAECAWEEVPANSIYLEARIYREYFNYLGPQCSYFSPVYAAYNGGAGIGCTGVLYPYGDIAAHMAVFNGWWQLANTRWSGGSPPQPPKPHYTFPAGTYEHFRRAHHKKDIPYRVRGHLTWAASVWWSVQDRKGHEVCRGIKRSERWYAKLRVMRTDYQRCVIFTWPTRRDLRPKVVRR